MDGRRGIADTAPAPSDPRHRLARLVELVVPGAFGALEPAHGIPAFAAAVAGAWPSLFVGAPSHRSASHSCRARSGRVVATSRSHSWSRRSSSAAVAGRLRSARPRSTLAVARRARRGARARADADAFIAGEKRALVVLAIAAGVAALLAWCMVGARRHDRREVRGRVARGDRRRGRRGARARCGRTRTARVEAALPRARAPRRTEPRLAALDRARHRRDQRAEVGDVDRRSCSAPAVSQREAREAGRALDERSDRDARGDAAARWDVSAGRAPTIRRALRRRRRVQGVRARRRSNSSSATASRTRCCQRA